VFYVEGINTRVVDNGDQSEEEDEDEDEDSSEEHHERHGGRDSNSDEDDDSGENGSRHRLRELKIRVYNHTVEFKRNRLLVVSKLTCRVTKKLVYDRRFGLKRCSRFSLMDEQ